MKKALTVALVAVLILSLPAVAMAARLDVGGGRGSRRQNGQHSGQQGKQHDTQQGNAVMNMLGNTERNQNKFAGESKSNQAMSQGAVHIELVIDAEGVTTLAAARGSHVETFELEIPADLTEDEALTFISEALSTLAEEAFGLEVNSVRLKTFAVDEETGAVAATFIASHGERLEGEEEEDVDEDELDGDEDELDDEQDEEEDDSTTDL